MELKFVPIDTLLVLIFYSVPVEKYLCAVLLNTILYYALTTGKRGMVVVFYSFYFYFAGE